MMNNIRCSDRKSRIYKERRKLYSVTYKDLDTFSRKNGNIGISKFVGKSNLFKSYNLTHKNKLSALLLTLEEIRK